MRPSLTSKRSQALLRGVFCRKPVNLDHGRNLETANFTTRFYSNYRTGSYLYTSANADGSSFILRRPAKPPKPSIGASGGELPITIQGAYVACGSGTWLFEHYGNGPANCQPLVRIR